MVVPVGNMMEIIQYYDSFKMCESTLFSEVENAKMQKCTIIVNVVGRFDSIVVLKKDNV